AVASSIDVPWPRPGDPAPRRAGFFLKLMLWRSKKLHTAVRLPTIRCLCIAETTSSSVKSGCSSISVSSQGACTSNGDVLPPRGLAAQLRLVKALHPFDCRTWADVELLSCLTSRSPAFDA